MKQSLLETQVYLIGGCAMLLAMSLVVRFCEWLPWVLFPIMFVIGLIASVLIEKKEGSASAVVKE